MAAAVAAPRVERTARAEGDRGGERTGRGQATTEGRGEQLRRGTGLRATTATRTQLCDSRSRQRRGSARSWWGTPIDQKGAHRCSERSGWHSTTASIWRKRGVSGQSQFRSRDGMSRKAIAMDVAATTNTGGANGGPTSRASGVQRSKFPKAKRRGADEGGPAW